MKNHEILDFGAHGKVFFEAKTIFSICFFGDKPYPADAKKLLDTPVFHRGSYFPDNLVETILS